MAYPVLTTEQEDKILQDIGYPRQQLQNDTNLLRKWLNDQEHFPESRKTECDAFLVSYLVGCKGSIEKAKRKLDKYYSIRGHGDLFVNRDNIDYMEQADTFQFFAALPKPLPDGKIVTIMGMYDNDLEKYHPLNAIKRVILYTEFRIRQGTGIHGGELLLADAGGMTATYATKINPSYFKPLITWMLEAMPLRIYKFIVFNTDTLLDTILNTVFRPLVSKKIQERMIVTKEGDLSKFVDCIDHLPSTYGGKEKDRLALGRNFSHIMKAGIKGILPTLGQTTDESKRPELNGFTDNPNFGAFGSIKTLVVD